MLRHQVTVDWVELEIQTAKSTNAQTVRRALSRALSVPPESTPFVEPMNAGNGSESASFRFRIQDPCSGKYVAEIIEALRRQLPGNYPPNTPKVVAIEVAFDTYRSGANRRQLAEIVADRYRFSTHQPADRWHLYRKRGETPHTIEKECWHRWELLRHLEDDWQLSDTPDKAGAEVRYHTYVKTYDASSRTHDHDKIKIEQLPQSTWRARFEVTLRGRALPIKTVADLKLFDFAILAEHFKWRRLADDLHPAARYGLERTSGQQLGRKAGAFKYRRKPGGIGRRGRQDLEFRASTVADDSLNAAAYEALRKLSRVWSGKGVSADFPELIEPETRVVAKSTPATLTMSLPTTTINNTPEHCSDDHDNKDDEASNASIDLQMTIDEEDGTPAAPPPHEAKS